MSGPAEKGWYVEIWPDEKQMPDRRDRKNISVLGKEKQGNGYRFAAKIYQGSESDAHLIAASPELLEAAKSVLTSDGSAFLARRVRQETNALEKLQKAIAKAEGKGETK